MSLFTAITVEEPLSSESSMLEIMIDGRFS